MSLLTLCPACDVGRCDDCHPGETREGLIGGWRCGCDHDPDDAERRRETAVPRLLRNREVGDR